MSNLPVQWIAIGLGFGYLVSNGTVTWKHLASVGVLLTAGVTFLLYRFQEHLLYQPRIFPQHLTPNDNPPGMRHPGEHQLGWEDLRLVAADGVKLHAWLIRPEAAAERRDRPTMMFFHENAGNMGLRMENLKMMYDTLNVNVFILSYRGYGESEGTPEEEGLYLDAEAAFQHLRTRTDIDTSRLVLFGRSLGGGVAIDLASKHISDASSESIACIVVENTFASISAMVDVVFPYLAFAKRAILRMKWDSSVKITAITKPILFLSGAEDEIVPASQMRSLYSAATSSSQKQMVVFPSGKHNDTWKEGGMEYINKLKTFIQQHAAAKTTARS